MSDKPDGIARLEAEVERLRDMNALRKRDIVELQATVERLTAERDHYRLAMVRLQREHDTMSRWIEHARATGHASQQELVFCLVDWLADAQEPPAVPDDTPRSVRK